MGFVDKIADRIADRLAGDDPQPRGRKAPKNCPRCGAKPDQRCESCGFGTEKSILCGICGYTFTAEEL